jgi:hypothetical protein
MKRHTGNRSECVSEGKCARRSIRMYMTARVRSAVCVFLHPYPTAGHRCSIQSVEVRSRSEGCRRRFPRSTSQQQHITTTIRSHTPDSVQQIQTLMQSDKQMQMLRNESTHQPRAHETNERERYDN